MRRGILSNWFYISKSSAHQPQQVWKVSCLYPEYKAIKYVLCILECVLLHKRLICAHYVAGIGGSLLFTTAGVVVLEHFDKRASLAVGIAGSGASAGTIVIPLLTHACIDAYGFRGAFLILSGVSLQCLVVALTFTPPPKPIQGKLVNNVKRFFFFLFFVFKSNTYLQFLELIRPVSAASRTV